LRVLIALIAALGAFLLLRWSISLMRDEEAPRLLVTLVALAVGVLGVWALFWIANALIAALPPRLREGIRPYIFIGPAVVVLLVYLVYPAINTIYLSFLDARSKEFVGIENYIFAFTDKNMHVAFRNNVLWLVLGTGASVSLGLVIAVLVDRLRRGEAIAKSLIFLPMAISLVGASVIWRFMYAFQPEGRPQTGLLNAVVVALGGEPVGWLVERAINNYALIIIMIWLMTGFAMVVLSAALKTIPGEIIEAARIDGASELQLFFRIIIPSLRGPIITVATTIAIAILKVFDIVFVMTSGQLGTEVIANRMYAEMFRFRHFGRGSTLAVVLLIAVIPIMVVNVRNLLRQRS
jgi:alpha-glucoside transport system permease protein